MTLRSTVEQAVQDGDIEALTRLVSLHGPAAIRLDDSPEELTTLHWAAAAGNGEIVALLLSAPISSDPRAARNNRFTPLHAASMNGHAAVCERLLSAGADPNARTEPQLYGPLHSAAFAGHTSAIRVLLAAGADPTLRNYRDERPADTAFRQGQHAAAACFEVASATHPPETSSFVSRLRKLFGRG